MPIDVGETTTGMESTDAAVSTDATESVLATTTTEEPSTDHEDPSVWAPSQNVEVRLHPQFLRTEEPKGPLSTLQEPSTTTTTTATTSEEDAYILGSSIFGRKMEVQHQQQQPQHGSFGVQTGRVRSKDNLGAALRRAVTGSPAVQRLQQSTSRMGLRNTQLSSARDKAGEITGRKIVGFGSLSSSNLPAPKLPSNSAVRKETLFKNRPAVGHGGETPAGTHIESLSSHWLYGTGKGMQIVKLQESTICFISWWHINYTGSVFFRCCCYRYEETGRYLPAVQHRQTAGSRSKGKNATQHEHNRSNHNLSDEDPDHDYNNKNRSITGKRVGGTYKSSWSNDRREIRHWVDHDTVNDDNNTDTSQFGNNPRIELRNTGNELRDAGIELCNTWNKLRNDRRPPGQDDGRRVYRHYTNQHGNDSAEQLDRNQSIHIIEGESDSWPDSSFVGSGRRREHQRIG